MFTVEETWQQASSGRANPGQPLLRDDGAIFQNLLRNIEFSQKRSWCHYSTTVLFLKQGHLEGVRM